MKRYLFIFLVLVSTCIFAASQEGISQKLSEGDWYCIGSLTFIVFFVSWMTFIIVFVTRQNKKYSKLYSEAQSKDLDFDFSEDNNLHVASSSIHSSQDYSGISHRYDDEYRGVNPATGLPVNSRGMDIAGNLIGSNYTSPSYTCDNSRFYGS